MNLKKAAAMYGTLVSYKRNRNELEKKMLEDEPDAELLANEFIFYVFEIENMQKKLHAFVDSL